MLTFMPRIHVIYIKNTEKTKELLNNNRPVSSYEADLLCYGTIITSGEGLVLTLPKSRTHYSIASNRERLNLSHNCTDVLDSTVQGNWGSGAVYPTFVRCCTITFSGGMRTRSLIKAQDVPEYLSLVEVLFPICLPATCTVNSRGLQIQWKYASTFSCLRSPAGLNGRIHLLTCRLLSSNKQ